VGNSSGRYLWDFRPLWARGGRAGNLGDCERRAITDQAEMMLSPAVRDFRPRCPGCTPSAVVAPDARPCSYYDCPWLPEELQVTCTQCMFDFVAGDGQVKCDHSACPTAIRLKANVPIYRAWVAMLMDEVGEAF
jgi:hypothetical protein